jgi:hypothetical protein
MSAKNAIALLPQRAPRTYEIVMKLSPLDTPLICYHTARKLEITPLKQMW